VTDVLHGVDLDLLPGQRALVTGASGSGKSTLAALLLRFLDPSAGTIELITGHGTVALDALDGDAVRRIIGLCAQDPYIFDTSLRENLRLARPDADDAQLVKALETARLGAWLASLPDGLDTLVGAHGTRLSGGQRQRIELARTVLGNRPIVVFDEPTEHLDERSAAALTADLLRATSGRTTIFITHRPGLMAALQPAAMIDLGRSSGEPAGSAVARPPAVTLAEADVLAAVPAPIVARAPRR
jgi:ATP-binding cassette subfamily C protein CydCD